MTLPDGWLIKPLAEVAQVVMGQSPDSKYYSEEEVGLPFLQGCAEFQGRHPKHAIYCSHSKKIGCAGSILLSVRAPVGRLNVANRDYVIGRGLAALSGTRVTQDFLEHFLVFQEPRLRLASQGSTFEAINSSELKQWPILHPKDKAEQAKIAEVLSTMDRAIEQTEALTAKQQRIKTGLMQDLLTRGIDEHGDLRSEQTHEFKDSPLGRIPVEWDPMPFGSCGQWFSGGTPSKAIRRFWGGGVPWVCPKDMKQFELHQSIDTITGDAVAAGARLMPTGTVFIVIRGMILAHTFPVGGSTTEVAFNQDVKAIVPKQGLMGRYLAYWLSSHSHQFLKLATTATHGTKRFDMDELQAALVGVPLPNEQKHIVRIFDEQQSVIERLQGLTAKLQAEKRGLMKDLLTGDRRVTALLAARGESRSITS